MAAKKGMGVMKIRQGKRKRSVSSGIKQRKAGGNKIYLKGIRKKEEKSGLITLWEAWKRKGHQKGKTREKHCGREKEKERRRVRLNGSMKGEKRPKGLRQA